MTIQSIKFVFVVCLCWIESVNAFGVGPSSSGGVELDLPSRTRPQSDVVDINRREVLANALLTPVAAVFTAVSTTTSLPSYAYTPDSDPLRESLYLICRVQEATCLQERYIQKKSPPIQKMKLTLRLVDKSYRLLDQINYCSRFIPGDDVVVATQLGNESAESLQDAIDFVFGYKASSDNPMTKDQKEFLIESLVTTRERLFDFLEYLPDQNKVLEARKRVEEENKLNVDEFDPDLANDAGIYNPIVLPWKNRNISS